MAYNFYEFFAGGGMAAIGLGPSWHCTLANDLDSKKAAAYRANHPSTHFVEGDIGALRSYDLPGQADLAWASFPCQDLSVAGAGRGLSGARSGAFWSFERLMAGLVTEARAPKLIVIENVVGLMSSNGGRDLETAASSLCALGYRLAMFTLNASHFTPQSRSRLFLVCIDKRLPVSMVIAPAVERETAEAKAASRLAERLEGAFLDIRPPKPPRRNIDLTDIVDWSAPTDGEEATSHLLSLMDEAHRARLDVVMKSGVKTVGAVYRRTRKDKAGARRQRAEVRFDGLAGCLRTPSGGSSRQTLLLVDGDQVRSRLVTPREAADLMGLPDDYRLPARYNDAYKLCGDGVVAPVVRFLAETLLEPLLASDAASCAAA